MTQDEIIRMALEAGYQSVYLSDAPIGRSYQFLERFAALVAAHERELCAKVCDELQNNAVAKYFDATAGECAAAIRARGENGTA